MKIKFEASQLDRFFDGRAIERIRQRITQRATHAYAERLERKHELDRARALRRATIVRNHVLRQRSRSRTF